MDRQESLPDVIIRDLPAGSFILADDGKAVKDTGYLEFYLRCLGYRAALVQEYINNKV